MTYLLHHLNEITAWAALSASAYLLVESGVGMTFMHNKRNLNKITRGIKPSDSG